MHTIVEPVNENIVRYISYLKEEITNINQNLQIFSKNDSERCTRLVNIENHLFKLFGENEKHFNIYEMIDLVVESLKQLKEEFASSKSQFQLFRNTQEDVLKKVAKKRHMLSSQNKSFYLVFEKIESLELKQVYYQTTNLI